VSYATIFQSDALMGLSPPEPMAAPELLAWRFSKVFGELRDIPSGYVGSIGEICDLGHVDQGGGRFEITPYAKTESFPGYLCSGESMQLRLDVAADNFTPKGSYVLEISWDGKWTPNLNEMEKHLIVKEAPDGKL
jgi:hypothetical protein